MDAKTDARSFQITQIEKTPQRIVSLVPSQTELLYYLGLDENVVGITKFCVHPNQWHRTKKRIGGTKTVDVEKVKTLLPDLVLANKEENVQAQIEELAMEFPVWVTDVNSVPEALQMIETVGNLTRTTEKAAQLKHAIRTGFSEMHTQRANRKQRVCYLIWNEPFMTVGGDTFIHAMLREAGFENCFAHTARYPAITLNDIRSANCEVLFLSSEPYPFSQKHLDALAPQLPQTKIVLVDGELFSWYGSRLLFAPAYFANLQKEML